jgi:hypothetical protein
MVMINPLILCASLLYSGLWAGTAVGAQKTALNRKLAILLIVCFFRHHHLSQKGVCIMTDDTKTKGPASYFPSIEKKYGQPITYWLDLLKAVSGKKHMEMVALLKTEHGMGHGHSNALVAHYLATEKGN